MEEKQREVSRRMIDRVIAFRNYWKQHYRFGIFLIGVVLMVGIGVPVWIWYRSDQEAKISSMVNQVIRETSQINVEEELSLLEEETLQQSKQTYLDIYDRHTSYKNGVRALFLCGNIEFRQGNWSVARQHYQKVYAQKKHYLAPHALYYASLSYVEEQKEEEALKHLEQFELYYSSSYLYGEAMMTKAVLLEKMKRYKEAREVYQALASHGAIKTGYGEEALKAIQLMQLKGFVPNESSYQLPSSGGGAGNPNSPGFLSTNEGPVLIPAPKEKSQQEDVSKEKEKGVTNEKSATE